MLARINCLSRIQETSSCFSQKQLLLKNVNSDASQCLLMLNTCSIRHSFEFQSVPGSSMKTIRLFSFLGLDTKADYRISGLWLYLLGYCIQQGLLYLLNFPHFISLSSPTVSYLVIQFVTPPFISPYHSVLITFPLPLSILIA